MIDKRTLWEGLDKAYALALRQGKSSMLVVLSCEEEKPLLEAWSAIRNIAEGFQVDAMVRPDFN